MTKKIDFLPALKGAGFFKDDTSVHAIGVDYMDDRDKQKLCAPAKTYVKEDFKWNLQKTCDGDFFTRSVRQETDIYDLNLLKYMRTQRRGLVRPGKLAYVPGTTKTKDEVMEEVHALTSYKTRYMATNSRKWDPNDFLPNLLNKNLTPLLDNTHTPRGAKRETTLERCFDHQPWMYNRTESAHFGSLGCGGNIVEKDKHKSKVLKKKLRQIRRGSGTHRSSSKSFKSNMKSPNHTQKGGATL